MSFTKVAPYQGEVHQGCLNCAPVEKLASMDMLIAVGFGYAGVIKDDEQIFFESVDDTRYHSLQEFEDMALADPDHDWRVILDAPLRSRTYQRHDVGKWVLIESGMGFA